MTALKNIFILATILLVPACEFHEDNSSESSQEVLPKQEQDVQEVSHRVEFLREVSEDCLEVGQELAICYKLLKARNLKDMFGSHSGRTATEYFGSGNLSDPVLILRFDLDDQEEWLLSNWKIEE